MSVDGTPETALKQKPALKPRRPRPDGLTYSRAELAFALGVSLVQLGRLKHRLPPALGLGRHPRWCRAAIREWVEGGCKARR
jgi:hypothetical protein